MAQAKLLKARRIDQRLVRAPSIQYQVVVVVVWRPELSACEISPVSACAPGTSRLISVLLPEPEEAAAPRWSCPPAGAQQGALSGVARCVSDSGPARVVLSCPLAVG